MLFRNPLLSSKLFSKVLYGRTALGRVLDYNILRQCRDCRLCTGTGLYGNQFGRRFRSEIHRRRLCAPPQLFVLFGGIVSLVAFAACCRKGQIHKLKTDRPIAMLIRSVMTVVSATLFFYAMRVLPLAEIFLFVGLMPIMAALLTPFVLKEAADARSWMALIAGFVGVLCLFPDGISSVKSAHLLAFGASFSGVVSMVLARHIGRDRDASMALLFYPHLLAFIVMLAALPFVYRPMPVFDLGIAALYSGLLFVGRYVLVRALAIAPTHVVLPVVNVQFIWMVVLGAGIFAESPTMNVYLGAAIVIMSCVALV